jgi:hypothetical protein
LQLERVFRVWCCSFCQEEDDKEEEEEEEV